MLPHLAVFLISAAALAYEILLMRLLGIIQWHHFASMIISLALLGFGASGTFTALAQKRLLDHFHFSFAAAAVLFSITAPASFAAAQQIPFNPLEILWDSKQFLYLVAVYLILSLPFFFAATCISIRFMHSRQSIHRVYLFDLLGAGFGALGIILLLFLLDPSECLSLISPPGLFAAAMVCLDRKTSRSVKAALILFLAGILIAVLIPFGRTGLRISEYKGLYAALRVPGAEVIRESSSPLGWITVVNSPVIPFRHVPGMSLNCTVEPPEQLGIFIDADSFTPVTRYRGNPGEAAYLDCVSSALPFHLLDRPSVLILGAGGGADVLLALYHQASSIDAVELDPEVVRLVREDFGEFAGHIYASDRVTMHIGEGRGFVAGTHRSYDLIHVSLLDSFHASAAGGFAMSESYLYTVEAFQRCIKRLRPGGFLSITRWLRIPPRDSLKLFATALAALERSGTDRPGLRLALVRSWKTCTLLVKNGEFTPREIEIMRSFCESRSFDIDYFPGITEEEVNRFNVTDEPVIHEGAMALLGPDRIEFMDRYKFNIQPASDDRPYFFHFFKWRVLPEVLSLKGRGGLPLMEWTYPILVMTLVQALAASLILIILPLFFLHSAGGRTSGEVRIGFYFLFLGLAFLFMEIAFIQKFILFLSHPLYAVSVVLSSFLVFAGLGSSASGRWSEFLCRRGGQASRSAVGVAVGVIAVLSIAYLALLPSVFEKTMAMSDWAKIPMSMAFIAPLAFFMGMPFPLGLSRVADSAPHFIPWAWGINGCASVLSAVLAALLAIHLGFAMVVGFAVVLYAMAALVFWKPLG